MKDLRNKATVGLIVIAVLFTFTSGMFVGKSGGTRRGEVFGRAGKTIIVDDDGGGDHETIQAAIDAANSGDTIHVWAGTYNENVVVNKTVTLIGNGSGNTVVDGGGEGDVMHINANWVNVSGFRFTNAGDDGVEVHRVDHTRLWDNLCDFNNYGIYLYYSNNSVLRNNSCNNNFKDGIILTDSNSNSISNNTSDNNGDYGIDIYLSYRNSISNNTCNNRDFLTFIFFTKSEEGFSHTKE